MALVQTKATAEDAVCGIRNGASPVRVLTDKPADLPKNVSGSETYASVSSASAKSIQIQYSDQSSTAIETQLKFHVVSRRRPDAKSLATRASLMVTSTDANGTDIQQVKNAIRDLGTEIHVHAIKNMRGDKIKIDAGTRTDMLKIKDNLSGKGYSATEDQCMGPKFILFDAQKSWTSYYARSSRGTLKANQLIIRNF